MQRQMWASVRPYKWAAAIAVAILNCFFVTAAPASDFQLITPSEAALPAAQVHAIELRGSPTRGPQVIVVRPAPDGGMVHSPLELILRFRAFGGAAINPDSVVLTYLKQPQIDITQRITRFITAAGIDIKQADVPPGLHQFWIELKDNEGRTSGTEFSFQVAK